MNARSALKIMREELHISHSQLTTYLGCSLKYYFAYVEGLPPERIPASLPFGSAVHAALEGYYHHHMQAGQGLQLKEMTEIFDVCLSAELAGGRAPILYKGEATDEKTIRELGHGLLSAFHSQVSLEGWQVAGVELPLSADLLDEGGRETGYRLIGSIDLLLQDAKGLLLAVDHKTAKQAFAQANVDEDLQFSSYSCLLVANGFSDKTSETHCRYDVLRKLKTPKFEQYHTLRTPNDRRRFKKIANAALIGIGQRIFLPCRSWMCSDCQFADACARW